MKAKWLRRLIRGVIGLVVLILVLVGILAALLIWRPKDVLLYTVKKIAPESQFTADQVHWKSKQSIVVENASFGKILKVPRMTLTWDWKKLFHQHLEELKLEGARLFVDLEELSKLGDGKNSLKDPSVLQIGQPWYLGKLTIERGGLVVIGLGKSVPPLDLEMEGEFKDIPLGGKLSETDLQAKRTVELRQIHIHSPVDLAVTLLTMESIVVEFRFAGLRSRELDSLVFNRPILDIDRGFFWFVEELRKAYVSKPSQPESSGPEWQVHFFEIRDGQLDITRLHEVSIQYPFRFKTSRKDLRLKNLSLAEFQNELEIPNQDLFWEKEQMSFKNIRGKIAFNLGEPQEITAKVGSTAPRPANNVVNTLYVDAIRWKDMELNAPWLSITFDPKLISGNFGGSFAKGYINGGMMCGWSSSEPWRVWGSASDVETGEISNAMDSEVFSMNGRAGLGFDVEGKALELRGDLKLNSLSKGVIQIHSIDILLERIQKNTEGIRRELLETFVGNLKEYPYKNYVLEVKYARPDATVNFNSEGDRGSRKLDLQWHGDHNEKLKIKN